MQRCKSTDGLYNIKFNPFIALNEQKFVMVIFSIDMYHEVLPIIKGTRWVFKRPLFTKKDVKKVVKNEVSKVEIKEVKKDEKIIVEDVTEIYNNDKANSYSNKTYQPPIKVEEINDDWRYEDGGMIMDCSSGSRGKDY